jgi:hypothetical protein
MPQLIPRTFLLLCAIACLCFLTVHLLPADIRPNVAHLTLVIIIPPSTVLTIILLAVLWHFFSPHVHGATSLATTDLGPAHGPPVITAVHASSAQTACDGASSAPHTRASLIDLQHILYSALTQTLRCLTTILLSGTWKTSLTLVRTPAPPPIDQSRDRQGCRWHCSPSTSLVATHAEDVPWQGMCSWCTDFLLRGIDDTEEDPHIHVPRCRDERDGVVPVMPEYYPTPTPSPTPSEW